MELVVKHVPLPSRRSLQPPQSSSSSARSCSAKTNLFALLYAMKKQLFNPPEASKKFLWAILFRNGKGFFQRKWEKSTCGFVLKTSCSSLLWQKKRRLLFFEAVAIQKERHKNCLKICLMNWWANRKFLQKIKTERRSEPRRHEKSIMIYSGILPIMLCCVSFKAIKYGLDLKGETKVIVRIFLLIFRHNFLHHLQQKSWINRISCWVCGHG